MFVINEDKSIYATRGDIVFLSVSVKDKETGEKYIFKLGDVVKINVFGKKDVKNVVLEDTVTVTKETEEVEIFLNGRQTKFGEPISKPKDYWYEIVLNPETNPQTIVGYDEEGPKIFRIYPEGNVDDISSDVEDYEHLAGIKRNIQGEFDVLDLLHGKSAYEIAVLNGFEGTEQEWLESLKYVPTADEKAEMLEAVYNFIGKTYSDKLYERFGIDKAQYPYIAIFVNETDENDLDTASFSARELGIYGFINDLYFLRAEQNDITAEIFDFYRVSNKTVVNGKNLEEVVDIFLQEDTDPAVHHPNTVFLPTHTNVRTYINFIPSNALTNNITTFDIGDTLRDEIQNIMATVKEIEVPTVLFPKMQISLSSGGSRIGVDFLVEGKTYKVVLNGVEYECVCQIMRNTALVGEDWYYLGNIVFHGKNCEPSDWVDYKDTKEPFCIIQHKTDEVAETILNTEQSTVTFSLIRYDFKKAKLDWVSYVDAINSRKETTANKTKIIDGYSTDVQYPTAKAVRDYVFEALKNYALSKADVVTEFDPETSPDENQVYSAIATATMGQYLFDIFSLMVSDTEHTTNKITAIDESSTDYTYPSAKAVVDYVHAVIGGIENGSY